MEPQDLAVAVLIIFAAFIGFRLLRKGKGKSSKTTGKSKQSETK